MSRLNPGTIVAVLVAVLLSLAGAFLARQVLLGKAEPPAPKVEEPGEPPKIGIYVATADLSPGRVLKRGDVGRLDVSTEQLKKMDLPAFYVTDGKDVVGRILKTPVEAGHVFPTDAFYPEGTAPTVADELEPGYRAVTIQVSSAGFVDGFAAPGTRVDVLFRLGAASANELASPAVTYTILEDILVLAVERTSFPGSQVPADANEPIKVTLAVKPQQASQLKVLEGNGELALSLRSPDEKTRAVAEAEMQQAAEELLSLRHELQSLQQIVQAAAEVGSTFDDKGRTEQVSKLIEEKEHLVSDLQEAVQTASEAPRKQDLAEVLQLETPPSIAEKLPAGMRAVTVAVNGSGGVDGFAAPGTFVDVLFRLSELSGREDYTETTFTLLEGVQILAVAQTARAVPQVTPPGDNRSVPVTLAVTPEQASKLKVVEGRGELSLVLRAQGEPEAEPASPETDLTSTATDLEQARVELEELQIELESLERIAELAATHGRPFSRQDRLEEVSRLVKARQEDVERLQVVVSEQGQQKPTQEPRTPVRYTLPEVLGIPAPPPEPTPAPSKVMEVYLGGQRRVITFQQTSAGTTTAADDCPDCDKNSSVIRRPL